jgi:hypothetical protein
MLSDSGEISFVDEILQLVEECVADYEAAQGAFRNPLERGLVVSYVLGVLRCQLDAVWDALGDAPVSGPLHPRLVFEECVSRDQESVRALRQRIVAQLGKRQWFDSPKADS